jgi:hypothetical protein
MLKIMVAGSGEREHALRVCRKGKKSPDQQFFGISCTKRNKLPEGSLQSFPFKWFINFEGMAYRKDTGLFCNTGETDG